MVGVGEFKSAQMLKAFDDVVFKKAGLTVYGPIKAKIGIMSFKAFIGISALQQLICWLILPVQVYDYSCS